MVLLNADVYNPPGRPGYSGYHPTRDKGMLLTIRASNEGNIEPQLCYTWAMPGGTGGDPYRENISGCNHRGRPSARRCSCEPGDKVGPTSQGIDDLIAKDPNAYWDDTNKRVVSTMKPSPRVFPIPLFDPDYYEWGKVNVPPTSRCRTGSASSWTAAGRGARPPRADPGNHQERRRPGAQRHLSESHPVGGVTMARLSGSILTEDAELKTQMTALPRGGAVPVTVTDERPAADRCRTSWWWTAASGWRRRLARWSTSARWTPPWAFVAVRFQPGRDPDLDAGRRQRVLRLAALARGD